MSRNRLKNSQSLHWMGVMKWVLIAGLLSGLGLFYMLSKNQNLHLAEETHKLRLELDGIQKRNEVLALDLTLDDDLVRRGLVREVIRNVQDLRKATGLEVSDWIHLYLVGLDDLEPLFEMIGRVVLARTVVPSVHEGGGPGTPFDLDDGDTARQATAWVVKA